jgi:hypothetical protein
MSLVINDTNIVFERKDDSRITTDSLTIAIKCLKKNMIMQLKQYVNI